MTMSAVLKGAAHITGFVPTWSILFMILLPVLSFLAIVVLIVGISILCIKRRRKKATLVLMRRREFDAYVCYAFDQDDDFVINTILAGLEKNQDPPFKLCIHSRDFKPGDPIFDNIQKAISQSNSAIMIMSQAFVDSIWCKAEFEQCFIENLKDPAFKLFLIMMHPVETLENLTKCMTSFISQKTYLKRDDPDLTEKISEYLNFVKQPKGDNDDDGYNEEEQIQNDVLVAENDSC